MPTARGAGVRLGPCLGQNTMLAVPSIMSSSAQHHVQLCLAVAETKSPWWAYRPRQDSEELRWGASCCMVSICVKGRGQGIPCGWQNELPSWFKPHPCEGSTRRRKEQPGFNRPDARARAFRRSAGSRALLQPCEHRPGRLLVALRSLVKEG